MLTLTATQTLGGWLELSGSRHSEPVEFNLQTTLMDRRRPWQAQPFLGTMTLTTRNKTVEAHGYISLQLRGLRYEMRFKLPDKGPVSASGEMAIDLFNLSESLRMCPLTVYQNGAAIGYMEIALHGSMLASLRGLRLVRA